MEGEVGGRALPLRRPPVRGPQTLLVWGPGAPPRNGAFGPGEKGFCPPKRRGGRTLVLPLAVPPKEGGKAAPLELTTIRYDTTRYATLHYDTIQWFVRRYGYDTNTIR